MVHQKIINLFIDNYVAIYIKNQLRTICAKMGVNCIVNYKYKMVNNASLRIILQGHDLNLLTEIELKLDSLNGEVVEETPNNEIEEQNKE